MDDHNQAQNNETKPNQAESNTGQAGFNKTPLPQSELPAVTPATKVTLLWLYSCLCVSCSDCWTSSINYRYKKSQRTERDKKGIAIAGLVISIISIVLTLLIGLFIFVAIVSTTQNQAKNIGNKTSEENKGLATKDQKSLKDGSSRSPFAFEKSYELKKVCESNARPSNAVASTDGAARTEVFSESDIAKGSYSSGALSFTNEKFRVEFDNQNNVDYVTCLSLKGSSDTTQSCDLTIKDQPTSITLAKYTYDINVYSAKTGDLVLSNKTVSTEESCPRFFTIIKNDRVYGSIDSGALELELEPLLP